MASELIWAVIFAVIAAGIILLFSLTVRRMIKGKSCCNCGCETNCKCCPSAKKKE